MTAASRKYPAPGLDVGPEGGTWELDFLPADEVLVAARLFVQANRSSELKLDAEVAPGAGKKWASANWETVRTISGFGLDPAPEVTATNVKVSAGGVWYTPAPPGTLQKRGDGERELVLTADLKQKLKLPPTLASSLLVEYADTASIGDSKFKVEVLNQTENLSIAVEDREPFFERAKALPEGEEIPADGGLLAELLAVRAEGRTAPRLVVRTAGPALIDLRLEYTLAAVARPADLELPAPLVLPWGLGSPPWGKPLVLHVPVPADRHVHSLELEADAAGLRPERVLLQPRTVGTPDERAQLVDADHQLAQGFTNESPVTVVGLDLLLEPLTERVTGELALHADAAGRPDLDAPPLAVAPLELATQGSGPQPPTVVPCTLPDPVDVEGPWWAVVSLTDGQALWSVTTAAPHLPARGGIPALAEARQRARSGPWLLVNEEPELGAWAACRLRGPADGEPRVAVRLRRGSREVAGAAASDALALRGIALAQGRLTLGPDALAALNGAFSSGSDVEVVLESDAPGTVALVSFRLLHHAPPGGG